jgi:hypothetical protein
MKAPQAFEAILLRCLHRDHSHPALGAVWTLIGIVVAIVFVHSAHGAF